MTKRYKGHYIVNGKYKNIVIPVHDDEDPKEMFLEYIERIEKSKDFHYIGGYEVENGK